MKKITDISYGDGTIPRQMLDLYLPVEDTFSVLVYFHGGGLEGGSKDIDWIGSFAENGIAVAVPNYRLYPYARYPEFILDTAAATAWVHKNINRYGKCENIFVGGSSAGAYLALMLCMDGKYLAPYGISPDSLSGYIFDAGQTTVHFNVLREAGIDSRAVIIDERAPIYHIKAERSYPPMLVICGENDLQNRLEQNKLFISTLLHFGHTDVEFRLMDASYGHCGYDGKPVFKDMVTDFMRKYVKQ
jgi:acetyl esterase/lipase